MDKLDKPIHPALILLIPVYTAGVLSLLVLLPAGDWSWPEGWIFVISISVNIGIGTAILNRSNPRVLRNRSRMKKKGLTGETEKPASSDRFIMPAMTIGGFGAIIIAALGHRFGWHTLHTGIAITGSILANLGTILLQVAQGQNAHASKILDINKDQVLIDTGLYSRVRHPLYTGGVLMMLSMPLALGSLWGLPLALLAIAALVIRIRFEEEMLLKGMPGYEDYRSRVKYRLIPGIY